MSPLKQLFCILFCAAYFAFGAVGPFLISGPRMDAELDGMLTGHPLWFVIVGLGLAAFAALVMYVAVHFATRQPPLFLWMIELLTWAMPAFALGLVVPISLGLGGITDRQPVFLSIFAISYFCGGIAGLYAIRSIRHLSPEERALRAEKPLTLLGVPFRVSTPDYNEPPSPRTIAIAKWVCPILLVHCFVSGIVAPLLLALEKKGNLAVFHTPLDEVYRWYGNSWMLAIGVVISLAAVLMTLFWATQLPGLKLFARFFVLLPTANALGLLVHLLLRLVGLFNTPHPVFLGACGGLQLCIGLAGLWLLRSLPGYRESSVGRPGSDA